MLRKLLVLVILAYLTGTSRAVRELSHKKFESGKLELDDDEETFRRYDGDEGRFRNEDETDVLTTHSPLEIIPPYNYTPSNTDVAANLQPLTSNFFPLLPEITNNPNQKKTNETKRPSKSLSFIVFKKNESSKAHNSMPKLSLDRETYILIHGIFENDQEKYVEDFFSKGSQAILNHCDCTVLGVKWKSPKLDHSDATLKVAVTIGKKIAKGINDLRKGEASRGPITIISHEMGNVAAAAAAAYVKEPLEYLFGLDQKQLHGEFKNYYLRHDMGSLVQTITTNIVQVNYGNYGHRNFYPNGGDYMSGDKCLNCDSYTLLFKDIAGDNEENLSTFCSTYEDYLNAECEHLPTVTYFNKIQACDLPMGNYFSIEDSILK